MQTAPDRKARPQQADMASGPGPVTLSPCHLVTLSLGVLLSLALAHCWAAWVLPPFNSNHLGCDACHHAIMIHCQSLSDPAERVFLEGTFADYPQTAHWLAAQWMPL